MDEGKIDRLAEHLRLAYADAMPHVKAHVVRHPWKALPEHRRSKWRHMAQRAIAFLEEGH